MIEYNIPHYDPAVDTAKATVKLLFTDTSFLAPEGCRYEPWWVPGRGHNDVLFGNESEFIR